MKTGERRRSTPSGGGRTLFDNGVPRAYGTTDFVPDITDIIPTYSPQLVFGYNNESTGFELTTMCVNSGVADPATRRVFFVTSFDQPVVSAYDMDTFLPAGSETLTTPSGAHAQSRPLGALRVRVSHGFENDSHRANDACSAGSLSTVVATDISKHPSVGPPPFQRAAGARATAAHRKTGPPGGLGLLARYIASTYFRAT